MESQFHIDDGNLSALERTLRELAPAPPRLDVAQTMFRAGQAAARQPSAWRQLWPATTVALAVLSMTLGTLLAIPDDPRIVYVPIDRVPQAAKIPASGALAADRNVDAPTRSSAYEAAQQARSANSTHRLPGDAIYLRARDMALLSPWSTTQPLPRQPTASVPTLCSGDWRAMIGDEQTREASSGT